MRISWQAAAMLISVTVLGSCGKGVDEQSQDQPSPQQRIATADRLLLQPLAVDDYENVSGSVRSVDLAEARARIGGVLTSLSVRAGDYVRKGQVIGHISDARLGYESSAFGAQAAAAEANAAAAQAQLARTRFLVDNGVYAKAALDQAQAQARAAQAQISAARAQQSAVRAIAEQGAVFAPSSGRVLIADIPAGSAVSPGMSLATITSGPLVLRIELPEALAGRVRVGSRVDAIGLTPEGAGADSVAAPQGRISKIYPSIQAGQFTADVTVAGLTGELIGRRITTRVAAGTRSALIVPRRFIVTRFGIDSVMLLGKDGVPVAVPVQLADSASADNAEILSGVGQGDTLIVPASLPSSNGTAK